ncbi:MAG: protein kinase [Polyangia bacterium]
MSASARSQLALAVDLRDASVLLVDDTPEQSEELLITLTEAGFKVMTASSGPQAKQKLMQAGADLVLLDLKGADMDSYELCRQLKAPPPLRSVPVVFLSAPSGDDVDGRVRAFRAGAADYLAREADFAELLVRLEHHIRLGRKVRELERERVELLRENRDLKKEKQTAPPPILTNLADLPTGYLLDGKYRLDTRIGAGGFGVVYRALHLSLQRAVAVKLFRSMANGSTDDALRRFRHEGTSASRLSHPNAVTMLDSGVAPGGIPYLAMELLVGRTLAEELKDKQRLGFARCLQIILPVCDVLVEAHAAGIVHRDIKPENVFLHRTRSGEVIKVLDFGIAKLVGEGEGIPAVTGAGGFIGTPTYMAPERLRQGSYDGRSDVYSVGVVLYQALRRAGAVDESGGRGGGEAAGKGAVPAAGTSALGRAQPSSGAAGGAPPSSCPRSWKISA